jgi:tricorn protease-like protein
VIAAYGNPRTETVVTVWIVSVDDTPPTPVTSNEVLIDYAFTWSPDGRWLAVAGPADSEDSYKTGTVLHLFDVQTGIRYTPADGFACTPEPPIWTSGNSVACADAVNDGFFEIRINY